MLAVTPRLLPERQTLVIILEGRLSTNEVKGVLQTVAKVFDDVEVVLVDCAELTHLDLDAICVVTRLRDDAKRAGKPLGFVGLCGQPERELTTTRVKPLIACYPTIDAALGALAPSPS